MMNIRKSVFFFLDSLRGDTIKKNCQEIVASNPAQEELLLQEMLEYVLTHVPYYKEKKYQKLTDFPVVNKSVYQRGGENFISDKYPNYQTLHTVKTSGSTGNPLVVYLSPDKRSRVIADLLVVNDKIGWNLGHKYVFLRNWTKNYRQSWLSRFAKNFIAVGVSEFNDERKWQLFQFLRKHPDYVLVGYSTSIVDFLDWAIKNKLDGKALCLKLIHCSAEELLDSKRQALREYFHCPVYNRYSNEEHGFIAMMMDGDDYFRVNTASLKVELLKLDSDDYVQPGEMGRVVITDLFNHAMPLIRYDIGDLAVSDDPSDNIRTIKNLCGRSADLLKSPNGSIISNTTAAAALETTLSVRKWQLAQLTETHFELRYVGDLTPAEEAELRERLSYSLGTESTVDLVKKERFVLPKTGKFKTIVNEMKVKL